MSIVRSIRTCRPTIRWSRFWPAWRHGSRRRRLTASRPPRPHLGRPSRHHVRMPAASRISSRRRGGQPRWRVQQRRRATNGRLRRPRRALRRAGGPLGSAGAHACGCSPPAPCSSFSARCTSRRITYSPLPTNRLRIQAGSRPNQSSAVVRPPCWAPAMGSRRKRCPRLDQVRVSPPSTSEARRPQPT